MPMKAHAHKNHNALKETIPIKRPHKNLTRPTPNTIDPLHQIFLGACPPFQVRQSSC